MYNYTMEGLNIEQRYNEFLGFVKEGSHFPEVTLVFRETGLKAKSIEISLESTHYLNVVIALNILLVKAKTLKAEINTSDADFWLTIDSPRGKHKFIRNAFMEKYNIPIRDDVVLENDVRGNSRVVFSLRFVS